MTNKYKKERTKIRAYTRWDPRAKKYVFVPSHFANRTKKIHRYKNLSSHTHDLTYYNSDDFKKMSQKDLIKLAKKNNIQGIENLAVKSRIIDKLIEVQGIQIRKEYLEDLTWKELYRISQYFRVGTEHHHNKKEYIDLLSRKLSSSSVSDWQNAQRLAEQLSNDEKYILRMLQQDSGGHSQSKIQKLVGKDIFKKLYDKNLIKKSSYSGNYYVSSWGDLIYESNKREFTHLREPKKDTMKKTLPNSIMKSAEGLAENAREYSIGIDFERELEQPQQILGIQGGTDFTFHLQDDFEMYGHTHPDTEEPIPSKNDLINLSPGRPEFLVAGNSGKSIIMQIGNENIYRQFKEDAREYSNVYDYKKYNLNTKKGRVGFLKEYGVRILPYKKGTKITILNDPHLEKRFPFFNYEQLQRISLSEKNNKKKDQNKKNLQKKNDKI